jgi:hypothetical protein
MKLAEKKTEKRKTGVGFVFSGFISDNKFRIIIRIWGVISELLDAESVLQIELLTVIMMMMMRMIITMKMIFLKSMKWEEENHITIF